MANKSRRLEQRREEAELRKQERQTRSDADQLKILDERLGENTGASKERARLERRIEESRTKSRKKKEKVK